jgi:hypothetical protein
MAASTQFLSQVNLRAQVEKKWPGFTPDELEEIGSNGRRLSEALQRKFGLSAAAAEQETRRLACLAWSEHRREEWLAG